jgi:hypothetical protein
LKKETYGFAGLWYTLRTKWSMKQELNSSFKTDISQKTGTPDHQVNPDSSPLKVVWALKDWKLLLALTTVGGALAIAAPVIIEQIQRLPW